MVWIYCGLFIRCDVMMHRIFWQPVLCFPAGFLLEESFLDQDLAGISQQFLFICFLKFLCHGDQCAGTLILHSM